MLLYSVTTSVPDISSWPLPQKTSQAMGNFPVLSGVMRRRVTSPGLTGKSVFFPGALEKWRNNRVPEPNQLARFEQVVLPHLDSAYNLARWLTRNDHDAEDVVQEAYLRAFKFFRGFHGGDSRAWLLTIVRHTCYGYWRRS